MLPFLHIQFVIFWYIGVYVYYLNFAFISVTIFALLICKVLIICNLFNIYFAIGAVCVTNSAFLFYNILYFNCLCAYLLWKYSQKSNLLFLVWNFAICMFRENKKCKEPVGCFVNWDLVETGAPMSTTTPVQARVCHLLYRQKILFLSLEVQSICR